MFGKIDETKFSKEIVARKRRNRKILAYSTMLAVITTFIYKNYVKLEALRYEKSVSMSKEMIVVNNSFLTRDERFYSNEAYLKKHGHLGKEWENEQEGIKFYGKSESTRQKYYTSSAYEEPESGTAH